VRAQASVEMDFDHSQETTEKYDPDQQVARSEQTITNNTKSTDAQQNVSVQNNLPNAAAGTTGSGNSEQHQESVTNYEIGKTVSTLVHDQPEIKRISLAVMVDGSGIIGADGKPGASELSAAQISNITNLVKSAIGYDESRGDKVEVISMPFLSEGSVAEKKLTVLGVSLENADLVRLAETGVLGLLALVGLMFVVRPTILSLTASPAGLAAGMGQIGEDGLPAIASAGGGTLAAPAGGFAALPSPGQESDDEFITVANIEGQLRGSSIRHLAHMVDKDPDATLSILRGWIGAEQN
jgi:flagellar M-ring protein FliF